MMGVKAKLEVVLLTNGGVQVSGLIGDLPFALGLLDLGKEALKEHHRKLAEGPRVEVASAGLLLNGGK